MEIITAGASSIRSASSTAFRLVGLSAASPERSSRFVAGSIRLCTVASGTCLTQTAIFIARGLYRRVPLSFDLKQLPTRVRQRLAGLPILHAVEIRPMPFAAVVAACSLLVGAASVMTWQGVALAADGAFQLVRILATGDVYGSDARILAAGAHQGAVVIAARAGVTDTQRSRILLGVGQLLLPAIAWSIAIVLCRADRLVCAAVLMIAGLSAGATWFVNVSEIVLAVPLTVLIAVLLWQPQAWRRREIVLAAAAASVLVASYETAVLTGSLLAVSGHLAREPLRHAYRDARGAGWLRRCRPSPSSWRSGAPAPGRTQRTRSHFSTSSSPSGRGRVSTSGSSASRW